jgi:hypothetical protein
MTTEIYYIMTTEGFLLTNSTWSKTTGTKMTFTTKQAALDYIENTLSNGDYSIISKIVKS